MISKEHSIYKYRFFFFFKGNAQWKRRVEKSLYFQQGELSLLVLICICLYNTRSVFILLRIKTRHLKRLLLLPGFLTSPVFSDSMFSSAQVQLHFPLFYQNSHHIALAEDYFSALPSPQQIQPWLDILHLSSVLLFTKCCLLQILSCMTTATVSDFAHSCFMPSVNCFLDAQ